MNMKKFKRKQPGCVEAQVWAHSNDMPDIVKYHTNKADPCPNCHKALRLHGQIDHPKGMYIVCPGDWVIKDNLGNHRSCKPTLFKSLYEPVD
jgi:hypothetical protein